MRALPGGVALRFAPAAPKHRERRTPRRLPGASAMTTVLAVDDSTSMRQMVGYALRRGGYEVLEAADGVEALAVLEGHAVDVLITDQNMPNMDGLQLTRAVRAQPRWGRLPILVLTTDADPTLKQAGREAGATGWLQKPFDPVRLLDVVRQVAPGTS
jgi:two-component system chemotaxis response regulator CheY